MDGTTEENYILLLHKGTIPGLISAVDSTADARLDSTESNSALDKVLQLVHCTITSIHFTLHRESHSKD